jgi:hypothetical protein
LSLENGKRVIRRGEKKKKGGRRGVERGRRERKGGGIRVNDN